MPAFEPPRWPVLKSDDAAFKLLNHLLNRAPMTDQAETSPPTAAADKTSAPAGGRDAQSDWARIAQDDEPARAPDSVMKLGRKQPDSILKK